jgi:hypothetical protein
MKGPRNRAKGFFLAMACTCGITVTNIYYNQPMLEVIVHSFFGELAPSFIPTTTQLRYVDGLLLLSAALRPAGKPLVNCVSIPDSVIIISFCRSRIY